MKRATIIAVLLCSMWMPATTASARWYPGWYGAYYRPYRAYYGPRVVAPSWGRYYRGPVYTYRPYAYPSGAAWGYPGYPYRYRW